MDPATCAQPDARRAVLYARVSTPARAVRRLRDEDRQRQDPETQLRPLRAYAAARGWSVVGEHVDRIPGGVRARPGLDAALLEVEEGRAGVLVVVRLDRIARSVPDLYEIAARLERHGAALVVTEQQIDATTPTGRLLFAVLGAIAAFEHDLISDRVRAGMDRARATGARFGRPEVPVDLGAARALLESGRPLAAVARALGVSRRTLARRLELAEGE